MDVTAKFCRAFAIMMLIIALALGTVTAWKLLQAVGDTLFRTLNLTRNFTSKLIYENLNCRYLSTQNIFCNCSQNQVSKTCELHILCRSKLCKNDGTCLAFNDTASCICLAGYSGYICENNINDCLGVTCQNGGKCIDKLNSFLCICATGFAGTFCQNDINECELGECKNGARCINSIGSFQCFCLVYYEGKTCDRQIQCLKHRNISKSSNNFHLSLKYFGEYYDFDLKYNILRALVRFKNDMHLEVYNIETKKSSLILNMQFRYGYYGFRFIAYHEELKLYCLCSRNSFPHAHRDVEHLKAKEVLIIRPMVFDLRMQSKAGQRQKRTKILAMEMVESSLFLLTSKTVTRYSIAIEGIHGNYEVTTTARKTVNSIGGLNPCLGMPCVTFQYVIISLLDLKGNYYLG